ncbi:hypothetical protein SAMN05660479_00098 [Microbulbifer thermotolerans]|uniref:hypothetical protein n=1 Tax=Microbulbifer thermotolerans TaxID=252514 RepID=UPI0008ECF7A9|nr:hypothetical protein [Microbulbifer thermotolerans]MCX2834151.1 hypothetical protein [Microbulbifer thermotolerans]SFB67498.1 hypothetical protein SAMN05660479_00098 [Microbulbifer thermotolerans]
MIKRTCSSCGSPAAFPKAFFASKSFPVQCCNCGKAQFRRHDASKTLAYLGASIGLFALLFVYMAKGLQVAIASSIGYLLLLFAVYVAELFVFSLSEYTDEEKSKVIMKSKKNIWIAVVVVFLGAIFYVFDV